MKIKKLISEELVSNLSKIKLDTFQYIDSWKISKNIQKKK